MDHHFCWYNFATGYWYYDGDNIDDGYYTRCPIQEHIEHGRWTD